MTVKVNMEERPVKISKKSKMGIAWDGKCGDTFKLMLMYSGTAQMPTNRSAKAKLINKKSGRLRNFFFRRVEMVSEFPAMIREAIMEKHAVQKGFHSLKSIFRRARAFHAFNEGKDLTK